MDLSYKLICCEIESHSIKSAEQCGGSTSAAKSLYLEFNTVDK